MKEECENLDAEIPPPDDYDEQKYELNNTLIHLQNGCQNIDIVLKRDTCILKSLCLVEDMRIKKTSLQVSVQH